MSDLKQLHEATGLGNTVLKSDGERRIITPGELQVASIYQAYGADPIEAKAAYFAALHNDFISRPATHAALEAAQARIAELEAQRTPKTVTWSPAKEGEALTRAISSVCKEKGRP